MEVGRTRLVFFSPTGTTRRVLEAIAAGISAGSDQPINLTSPSSTPGILRTTSDELVIIGAPVYGGRLPAVAVDRMKKLRANRTPAVLVVVYGNREFEDSLLELKDLARASGFNPIAGAAFIGEHSFASADLPIANGRPDDQDLRMAADFGSRVQRKIQHLPSLDTECRLDVPGRFPYEGGARAMGVSPVTKEGTCTLCGTCAGACPTGAISTDGRVATKVDLCIRCCACIKCCPTGSRVMEDAAWILIARWLNENCGTRKEPRFFGVDVNQGEVCNELDIDRSV